jgi:hypothetical protein
MDDTFNKAQSILNRYEFMTQKCAEKYSENSDYQYAYKCGSLMSEIRILAYRYPQVAADLDWIVTRWEKTYVVDVLSNDAKV